MLVYNFQKAGLSSFVHLYYYITVYFIKLEETSLIKTKTSYIMEEQDNIYTHYSDNSDRSNVRRVAARDISIAEEDEPCELHDEYRCKRCREIAEKKYSKVLKRSISSNAVGNVSRRRSLVNLYRTLSQTSCYSTGSTEQKAYIDENNNDTLHHHNRSPNDNITDMIWDNMTPGARDIIVKRLLLLQKSSLKNTLDYEDFSSEFQKNWKCPKRTPKMKEDVPNDDQRHRSHSRSRQSDDISDVVGEVYNKLLLANLMDERATRGRKHSASNIHSSFFQEQTTHNSENRRSVSFEKENLEIALGNYQLDKKIQELNGLLSRLEHYSPLPTPISVEHQCSESFTNNFTSLLKERLNISNNGSNDDGMVNKSHGLMSRIAMKSKIFMSKLSYKRKKTKSSFDLYRIPHPPI